MEQRYGNERDAEKFKWAPDSVERYARHGAEGRLVVENVGEHAADDAKRFFVAIDREGCALTNIERTNVIEAENVIGMTVSQQNGVKAVQSDAERLLTEIGRGV